MLDEVEEFTGGESFWQPKIKEINSKHGASVRVRDGVNSDPPFAATHGLAVVTFATWEPALVNGCMGRSSFGS